MKWVLYNALFAVVYAVMVPSFLLRMKRRGGYRARFSDRFGRYPLEIREEIVAMDRPIWIHAVSVGEVQVAGRLVRALRERDPSLRFVFSTTSSTGWRTALGEKGEDDVLIYNPLDFNSCVARAIDAVRPRAVILAETEIWPNFLRALKRRGIPVYLVNARISDKSAPRYKAFRWFFGEAFRCFDRIYVQSDLDAERLAAAGADPSRMEVTGSFKFDAARRNPAKETEMREWIGEGPIVLGGSTWPGEDAWLLGVYARILELRPEMKLVIAPRHFEKADAVEAAIRAAGFGCARRSRGETAADGGKRAVFLADTTGELMGLYGIAELVFVGKSLCAHGAQNMIEPCLCGTATVVGPYTENFRPVMSDLLAARAIVQAKDAAEAAEEMVRLACSPEERAALGARAATAVERRRGAVGRCADGLLEAWR